MQYNQNNPYKSIAGKYACVKALAPGMSLLTKCSYPITYKKIYRLSSTAKRNIRPATLRAAPDESGLSASPAQPGSPTDPKENGAS